MEKASIPVPAPFDGSYWVIPGLLLAGAYPGSQAAREREKKATGLLESGIRLVVNLMEPHETNWAGERFVPYGEVLARLGKGMGVKVEVRRFPIRDLDVPPASFMKEILDCLDAALEAGRPAYVHCWGGRGRTGTVVGCCLVRRRLATPENVLETIARLRSRGRFATGPSPETGAQREMVLGWRPET